MTVFPESLLDGYRSFRDGRYPRDQDRYRTLAAHGQTPDVLMIACCDSRAAPETIFDAAPGEIFVLRNVAAQVVPHDSDIAGHAVSAALEFAVLGLGVQHIVVLGHGRCGGVRAALQASREPLSSDDSLGGWIRPIAPLANAVASAGRMTDEERQRALEQAVIRASLANLRTYPYIRDLESRKRLDLHGAWFDIASAELWTLNLDTGDFQRAG